MFSVRDIIIVVAFVVVAATFFMMGSTYSCLHFRTLRNKKIDKPPTLREFDAESAPMTNAEFVAVWNKGAITMRIDCKVNLSTHEVLGLDPNDTKYGERCVSIDNQKYAVTLRDGRCYFVENSM